MAADRSETKFKTGGGESCVIVGCSNNRKRLYEWKHSECDVHGIIRDECPCLIPYSLHPIPNDEGKKISWIVAINRTELPKRVLVCSDHFVDSRPTAENSAPSLKLGYMKEVKRGRRILKRKLADNDSFTERNSLMETSDCEDNGELPSFDTCMPSAEPITSSPVLKTDTGIYVQTDPTPEVTSTGTQWCDVSLENHTYKVSAGSDPTGNHSSSTQTPVKSFVSKGVNCSTTHINMSCDKISTDSESLLYTGLTLQVFATFTQVFTTMVTPFKFTMNVADQLLLFLMRLRLNLLFADLGHRFGVSESQASNIFNCWLPFVSVKLKQLIVWLPRETIRATMPSAFKERYPKTTVIIDWAETFIQRPKNLKTRGETYSQYKSHNTVKYLVGVAPHGQIMFISKGFGGRASDKVIVENSGFLNYLLPGDEIMADRGFTINDLLFPLRVKLNMPAFTKGKPQLSEMEVTETRRCYTC